jgi:hypothetical protein
MATQRIFRAGLIAGTVAALAACASQPAPEGSLAEKQFQQAAQQYQKFERDGKTVYCRMAHSRIIPETCLSDSELRAQVHDYQRSRSTVLGPPIPAGAGQTGIGGS